MKKEERKDLKGHKRHETRESRKKENEYLESRAVKNKQTKTLNLSV